MSCIAALLQRHDVARGELSTRILSSGSAAQALLNAAMQSVIALHTEIAPTEVKLVRKLGEGSDASVWAGEWYLVTCRLGLNYGYGLRAIPSLRSHSHFYKP